MIKNKITLLDIDFHFGLGFLSSLIEGTGLAITDLGSQDDTVLIPKLMFYARKYACDKGFSDSMYKNVPVEEDKKKVTKAKK